MGDDLYTSDYGSFVGSEKGYCGFRNRLRISCLMKVISPKEGEWILEVGCNNGSLTKVIRRTTDNAYGVDINKSQIESIHDRHFAAMPATDLKFSDRRFDKVCSSHMIEHVPDIRKALSEMGRVLKAGGLLILSFPWEAFRGQAAVMDAVKIYGNPFYAQKLHLHRLTPGKIKALASGAGLDVVSSRLVFTPFPDWIVVLRKRGGRQMSTKKR